MMLRYNSGRGAWLKEYHKRWIVESVFSAVKRRLDPCLFTSGETCRGGSS